MARILSGGRRDAKLGTTPSGKAVWLEKYPTEYKNWSPSDHLYAAVLHEANRTPGGVAQAHRGLAQRAAKGPKLVAHATKAKAKTSDKINIDQLAKLFGLPDWEKIDEMNQDHYWEMSRGLKDEDAEMDAQQAAAEEVYNQWYDAVEKAASNLFEEHGLELTQTGKQGKPNRRYDFKIIPTKSWDAAANKLRETINGVGDFHFDDLKDFLHREGPSARKAVLSHLGYIKKYPHVYGGLGAHQMYEQAWR